MTLQPPFNPLLKANLTDMYQLTMLRSYWHQNKHNDKAVFDLFIRNTPFQGEFVIFTGLEVCLSFIANFKYTSDDIKYIKTIMPPNTEPDFFRYLLELDTSEVIVRSLQEGSIAFSKIPFMIMEGPLGITQLLETTLLNIVNFSSLVTTNAVRHCLAVDYKSGLIEFGTRRAQGVDGSLTASKCSYIGGFDGTSNVAAGQLFNIPVTGTHAHSFVMSFVNTWDDIPNKTLIYNGKTLTDNFVDDVLQCQSTYHVFVGPTNTNQNELASFTAYAISFPDQFLALIDTFNVFESGILNFIFVSCALYKYNIESVGIRLDSGDLAYQSHRIRKLVTMLSLTLKIPFLANIKIVASSDISVSVLQSIKNQPNSIDIYGVGTNLVTCQDQPALGGVYKLVTIKDQYTIKLSESLRKMTIPGKKRCFRLYNKDKIAVVDIMILENEEIPEVGKLILCRDPFSEGRRVNVNPSYVEELHQVYFENGKLQLPLPNIHQIRDYVKNNIKKTRNDHVRLLNPTPYKVSVSQKLYQVIHDMWLDVRPVGTIS
jgi:nicotinate phosphoribosyltransferase